MNTNWKSWAGLASLALAAGLWAQQPDPYAALAHFTFGQSRAALAQIEEQIRKTAPADYPAVEARLLALLKDSGTSQDAKRYLCRWLGQVGSVDCVGPVAELLTDPDLSHPARMALEPLAVPQAGAALRAALPKVQGKLLAGVISSLGVRRDALAVPLLASCLGDADPQVAGTALAAMGEIGTPEALKALDAAKVPEALGRHLARARAAAASHLAAESQPALAVVVFRSLMAPGQPPAIRVAGLKGLISALPRASAVSLIIENIQGADEAMRAATVAAFSSATDRGMKDAVADQLPAMKPAGQLILLGVLADDADTAARLGVLSVLGSATDDKVRAGALECLVRHGEAADVPMLVRLAAHAANASADPVRKTLQRMGKPGVDAALINLIKSPNAAERAAVLGVLASRRVEAALPTLVELLNGADVVLAIEAAKALGVMGTSGQLKELAGMMAKTGDAGLRGASEAAAQAICRRAADKAAMARLVLPAWEQATAPASRVALLQVLSFTGGEAALNAVLKAMQDSDAAIQSAATKVLIGWPEAGAGAHLVALAKSTPDATLAIVALRDGCLRLAQMEDLSMADRVGILRGVLDAAKRIDERKRAVAVLADLPVLPALALLQSCASEAALQAEAIQAMVRLAKPLAAVYPKQTIAALEAAQAAAPAALRPQLESALKAAKSSGQNEEGFLVAWLLAGPFTREGKEGGALFDETFPPEQPTGKAEWRPAAANKSGIVELDRRLPGDNRVAYLKTQILSPQEQVVQLELGSDDGLKVWLNGKLVHGNNGVHPCTPGSDKLKVTLAKGANTLLLKVTQSAGQWAACCRVRTADGKSVPDMVAGPSAE